MVRGVGIDQNLNAQIPLELTFKDETGQVVRLGQYFREKPVVLALVYYECPVLCDMVLNGLTHSMEQISLNVGPDFDVVTVSFNPHETWQLAAAKKANYIEKYQRTGAAEGWHFLTGEEAAIKSLADTVGFHYKYDPVTKQFAHASGIMVLTPEGKISRATSTGSNISREIFGWDWWKLPTTRSERPPTRSCCSASTTIP